MSQQPQPAPGRPPVAGGKTNPLAIASLVVSLVGMLIVPPLFGLAGLILGIVALGQIRRTEQGGMGLAIAGIVIGAVMVVLAVAGMAYLASNSGVVPGS